MPGFTLNPLLGEDAVFINNFLLLSRVGGLCQFSCSSFVQVVNLVVAGSKWNIEEMEDIVLILGISNQMTITVGSHLWLNCNHLKKVVIKS